MVTLKETIQESIGVEHYNPEKAEDRIRVLIELQRLGQDVDTTILQAVWNEWIKKDQQ